MATTKGVKPEATDASELPAVKAMSQTTSDVLFGGLGAVVEKQSAAADFDADMYTIRKLADEILAKIKANMDEGFAFNAARDQSVEPVMPDLEFWMPCPVWADL